MFIVGMVMGMNREVFAGILEKAMIVVISDVHLGGGRSHPDEFREFLIELIKFMEDRKDSEIKPRILLILGDIFDVLMSSMDFLSSEYIDIFMGLDRLESLGLRPVITLGNHEISVSGNYDADFSRRKHDFIDTFKAFLKKKGFSPNFFNKKHICQYSIMYRIKDDNVEKSSANSELWVLDLYDSKFDVPIKTPNNLRPIVIGPVMEDSEPITGNPKTPSNSSSKYLFCHGYQFFKTATAMSAELVWDPLLSANEKLKDYINTIYNKGGVRDFLKASSSLNKETLENLWIKWQHEINAEVNLSSPGSADKRNIFRFKHRAGLSVGKRSDGIMDDMSGKDIDGYLSGRTEMDNESAESGEGNINPVSKFFKDISVKLKENESLKKFGKKSRTFFRDLGDKIRDSAVGGFRKIKDYIGRDLFISTLENMIKSDEIVRDFKKIADIDAKIVDYLKEEDIFADITHVIYGHTHVKSYSEMENIIIANDGAWQHVEPSFITIGWDGDITIYDLVDSENWEYSDSFFNRKNDLP